MKKSYERPEIRMLSVRPEEKLANCMLTYVCTKDPDNPKNITVPATEFPFNNAACATTNISVCS